jgi:non-ribosomal peptide synthetase component F/acyl carrier protein
MVTHGNVTPVVKYTDYIELDERDRVPQLSNIAFDGSIFDIFGALLNGASLVMIDKEELLDSRRLGEFIERERVTVFFLTTALFNTLVDIGIECLDGVRKILFGGERISVPHASRALARLGKGRLLHMYGPTETTVFATCYFIDEIDNTLETIPIGKPLANTTVYILDQWSNPAPPGVSGEICIGGPGVARGYLNNPGLTSERFVYRSYKSYRTYNKKLYKTGDLARWLADGNIEFLGRIDHQVKIRGFRIELNEIENRLLEHPGIREAVVLVREDKTDNADRYLCAYIVGEEGTETYKKHLARWLPDYMVPSYFIAVESIPLTPNGKVDRGALPEPGIISMEGYIAPRNENERRLAEIWAGILGRDLAAVGIDDNFFTMGGHSLKAATMVSRVHEKLGVKLSLAEVFQSPTIRELAEKIEGADKEALVPIEPVETKEYYPPSFNQKRLWVIHQLAPHSPAYHIPGAVSLPGSVDTAALEKALAYLFQRHESLRTGFKTIDGEPFQFILEPGDFKIPFKVMDISGADGGEKERKTSAIITEIASAPFDLQEPPLFRSALVKQESDAYTFFYCLHHIVTDGWSMQLIQQEIARLYDDYSSGGQPRREPLRLHYKDFAAWQDRQARGPEVKENSHRYWKSILGSGITPLPLSDFAGGSRDDNRGAAYRCVLNAGIKERLYGIARENHTTLSMVLFSLYNLLLAFLSGRDEIAAVIISAGRPHPGLHDIIGYFINSVIVTNRVDLEGDFEELVGAVHARALEAFKHQDYPLELVLDDLRMEYPEVTAAFNFLNMQDISIGSRLNELEPYHTENRQDVKFDFTLFLTEYENGIEMNWEYRKSLFTPGTAEDIARNFLALADEITNHLNEEEK